MDFTIAAGVSRRGMGALRARPLAAALISAGLICFPGPSRADRYDWAGATGNWTDSSWVPSGAGSFPVAGDMAVMNQGEVHITDARSADSVYLGAGNYAALVLDASSNAALNVNTLVLGNTAAISGTLTVNAGATVTVNGFGNIGSYGNALVELKDGGKLTSTGTLIAAGDGPTSMGTFTLTNGASLEADAFTLGNVGLGILNANGATTRVSSGVTVLGSVAGSAGLATLEAGAVWQMTDDLTIARVGSGQLSVVSGSKAGTFGQTVLGQSAGASGTLSISGTGSRFSSVDVLYAGARGTGNINISSGGLLSAPSGVVVGRGDTGTGTINIDGLNARLDTGTSALRLGGDVSDTATGGKGTLEIMRGGAATTGQVWLGDTVGSSGTIRLQDKDTILASSQRLSVGHQGSGTVVLSGGATITSKGALIGHESTGTGNVVIGGAGTAWLNDGVFYDGNLGQGILTILDGGRLTSTDGYVATERGSTSLAFIDGAGSTWNNSGDFFVGHNAGARGTVILGNGGQLSSLQGILGDLAGAYGELTVTGAGSKWTTTGDLNVGRLGDGLMTVDRGGAVSAPVIQIANNAGSTGLLVLGAAAGRAPIASGTLDTPEIRFGKGDGQFIINIADTFDYNGRITGNGRVSVLAGDVVLGGANTYTGTTAVEGGSLTVNGALASAVQVSNAVLTVNGSASGSIALSSGSTLAGTGTVGATTLANGATLAPGNAANSIGTLTVNGDLTFQQGSSYRVQAQPGTAVSDRVIVNGTAHLAGSVLHVGPDGNFTPNLQYTILSAQALDGRFDSVASNYAFLDPTLAYGTQDVTMNLVQARAFVSGAATSNQRALANAVESLPQGHAVRQYVESLPNGAPAAAFDSLSGEAYSSVTNTLAASAGQVRAVPLDKLRANLQAPPRAGQPTAQLGASDIGQPAGTLPSSAALPAWAQVIGNWQTYDGNANTAKLRQHTGGVFVGGDQAVGAGWRLGGAFGFTDTRARVDDRDSQSDVSSYSALIYGGKSYAAGPGAWNVMMGAGYTYHDISTRRYADSQAEPLRATYGANTAQVFSEASYSWNLAPRTTLEPYAGVAWSHLHTRAFSESGGPAALNGEASNDSQTQTTLGLRATQRFDVRGREARVYAGLGWRHAFGDVESKSKLSFDAGQAFTVAGVPIARDAALAELGADVAVGRNATLGLNYAGQFSNGSREHSATMLARWRF
ncbi:autotransporter domain-containing protein [Bordetella sp. N]|uniref:autotransporter domain-containing protein n=1 Tax=Bordetella sp. N TaxID=1746199 RepID=UPI0018D261C3|nr:autotransporter domain-containing protein [Bordetella sp. N]